MSQAPVFELRVGLIKALVWRNQTEYGDRHNVTVARLYKTGDAWKESGHFGRDDLLPLAKVVDLAHSWIIEHGQTASVRDETGPA